jgi:hypothetical protein
MSKLLCGLRRHVVLVDVAIAVFFVVLDTVVTLVGWSWWPAQPDGLAWVLLATQGSPICPWSPAGGHRSPWSGSSRRSPSR